MYVTEVGLRRVIRNPMIERGKEVINVEDIKRRALSGEKPYDYFGVSLGTNPSVGEINSFVYTYCFRRGMFDQKKIESYIAYISAVVAIKASRDLKQHEYYLDLVDI